MNYMATVRDDLYISCVCPSVERHPDADGLYVEVCPTYHAQTTAIAVV